MADTRLRVLLVEDEALISLLLQEMLDELDCDVADTPANLDEALLAARAGTFDLALLDLSLGKRLTYPVADILKTRQIPFIFVTGYGSADLDPSYADIAVLAKPFRLGELEAMIARVVPTRSS
jgi:DNA-binding response OmpR family regulator